MELTPTKATFAPGEPIEIVVAEASGTATAELWHLDRVTATSNGDTIRFDPPVEGGYGVVATDAAGNRATTAFDVLADPFTRPRYGFVADFPADRDGAALALTARQLHLNLVQFYDWAHRYAQLVPDTERYVDPLGRELSLDTVRAMTASLRAVGSLAMGYAAVYAVGGVDWEAWEHAGLFKADGEPHRFTDDLLLVIDPANPSWMKHFAADLQRSVDEVGFDGFHLDSYGWPKRAFRADGTVADLNEAFATLLEHLRDDVVGARLLFNNVNDFPTWATTRTRQDGTYIEVWAPHSNLGHLAGLVERARAFRPGSTPILAAYLSVYAGAEVERADTTARLVMATIFSHGGTHLLNGEAGTLLIDPYYPKNHNTHTTTQDLMRHWYDFLVRYGDLLLDPEAVDVTRAYTGGINEDIVFEAPDGVRVSTDPEPGVVWVRVVRGSRGLVMHLINLTDQVETAWDAPKTPVTPVDGVTMRTLRTFAMGTPLVGDPDRDPALRPLQSTVDGLYDAVPLPPLGAWTMVVLPDPERW